MNNRPEPRRQDRKPGDGCGLCPTRKTVANYGGVRVCERHDAIIREIVADAKRPAKRHRTAA